MSGPGTTLDPATAPPFPEAARDLLGDSQLRRNVRHATTVIQNKRAMVVDELADWQELREAGRAIREHTMQYLDAYLEQFEANCTRAGGVVHWARDAAEARDITVRLAQEAIATASADGLAARAEVIKIKSMTTEEIGLNDALQAAGIMPYETDLAELIIQLGHTTSRRTSLFRRCIKIARRYAKFFSARCTCRTWATRRRTLRMRRASFCATSFCAWPLR